jgi:hypothetical protein
LKGAEAVLRGAAKSALDRRGQDRRNGDRRIAAETVATSGVRLMVSDGPDMAETIAALKAIRAKIATALEA